MGNSPRADLFYGYVFHNPGVMPWDSEHSYGEDDFDKDQLLLVALGIDPKDMGWKDIRDTINGLGIKFECWGDEDPCYFICINDPLAHFTCDWNGPTGLVQGIITHPPEWDNRLKKFANATGIDLKGALPAWHMVCSYG